MRLPLLFICFVLCADLLAQDRVKPDDIKSGPFTDKGIYRFPAFIEGTIVFRNGTVLSVRLNYNVTMDEMHFISQQGDTLAVAEPLIINFISISPYRFYYDKGYLQTIPTTGSIILAFKQVLSTAQNKKGAFGISTMHPGATSYSFFTLKGQQYNLDNEETLVIAREVYFFGDSYGRFSKANKEYILQHFEKKQASIKEFIKIHHTSFNKEKDLLDLLQYCGQLQ